MLRQEAVSRGPSPEASLHKPELFMPLMGQAEECELVKEIPREHWLPLLAMGGAPSPVS